MQSDLEQGVSEISCTTDVAKRVASTCQILRFAGWPLCYIKTRQTEGLRTDVVRFFLGLVVIARAKHPIPSRSRPLSAVAPMVLHLKVWESRSPPNLVRNAVSQNDPKTPITRIKCEQRGTVAGWSSPVARQAHNLKVTGSNPVPATSRHPPPA